MKINLLEKYPELLEEVRKQESGGYILSYTLVQLLANKEDNYFLESENLAIIFTENLKEKTNYIKSVSCKKIAEMMKTLGLSDFKGRDPTQTKRGYNFNFLEVSKILIRNEFIDIEILLNKVSYVAKCPIHIVNIRKWYQDTYNKKIIYVSKCLENRTHRQQSHLKTENKGYVKKNKNSQINKKIMGDLVQFIKNNDKKDNGDLIFDQAKFSQEIVKKAMKEGIIFQSNPNTYRAI